jgi:serine/threonine protein kinase
MFSVVYLGTDKEDNKYAIKFSKETEKTENRTQRELDFCNIMHEKYPNHFMKLYDYEIIEDDGKIDFTEYFYLLEPSEKTYYSNVIKSNNLVVKLFSYIDMTLYDYLNTWKYFNYELFYNILIQIIYLINIIHENGYYHGDIHFKNIGLTKTEKKYIEIANNKIPINGLFVTIIDYENIIHKKYNLSIDERRELKYKNDLFSLINSLYNFEELKIKYPEFKNINYTFFKIDEEDEKIIKSYLINAKLNEETRIFLYNTLYKLLFYEKIQKQILGDKFKKTIKPFLLIPLESLLFIISNINDTKKVLEYTVYNRFI